MKIIRLALAGILCGFFCQFATAQTADYQIDIGGALFDGQSERGFAVGGSLAYVSAAYNHWQFGGFVDFSGGGMALKNGLYKEPGINWQFGAKTRRLISNDNAYWEFGVGYGQNYLDGQLATGFSKRLFSHYLMIEFEFRSSAGRWALLNNRLNAGQWLNDASLFLSARWPLQEDKIFWQDRPVNFFAAPQIIAIGSEVSVIDAVISNKILLPIGLLGSFNQYDHKNLKFFYGLGLFTDLFYEQSRLARVQFDYQAGVSGVNFYRYGLGLKLDLGFFTKKNLSGQTRNNNNPTNNRKRSRP